MNKAIGLALAFSLAATPVAALDATGKYSTRGSGADSCGQWTEEHKTNTALSNLMDNWLMGYVTAYNAWFLKGRPDVADGLDAQGLIAAVTQFCAANPLNDVSEASSNLISQIEARKRAAH